MSDSTTAKVHRRTLFAGAGVAGAAAVAAALLPRRSAGPLPATGTAAPKVAADIGGYQVTDHVLDYYRTARV